MINLNLKDDSKYTYNNSFDKRSKRVKGRYRIHSIKKGEENLKNELILQKTYYDKLFNMSTDAIVFLTRTDRIVSFNKAFEKLFGYSLNEVKGKSINKLLAPGDKFEEAKLISEKTKELKETSIKTIRYDKQEREIPVKLTIKPIESRGEVIGIYGVYKDLRLESKMKEELRIQSQSFKKLFESSLDAMIFLDVNQKILDINKAFTSLFGYEESECEGLNIDDLIVPKSYKEEAIYLLNESLAEKPTNKETRRRKKDGGIIDVEASGYSVTINGKVIGIIINYRDISERISMIKEIEEQRAYFKQLFDNSPQAIVIIDPQERIVDVNKGFSKIFGYEKEESLGRYINSLIVPPKSIEQAEDLSRQVIGGQVVKYETKRRSKTNQLIDVDILAYPIRLNEERVGGYAIYSDISEKKRIEREIEFLAYRDNLTGLYNRGVFYDKLREKIKTLKEDEKLAVCYIDLNGFKKINDNMGHNIGDELLRYVAKNIEDSLDREDVVARMGGDEFVIFSDFIDCQTIGKKMKAIIDSLNSGLKILDYSIKISLSIGVALYPDHGKNVDEIVKKADIAMYKVKRDGLSGYLIYTKEMEKNDRYLYQVESCLKMALANNEIKMNYQPILSMDGRVKGCEALMRWENPILGRIPPSVFIPLAEGNGEIYQLGIFAFNKALSSFKKWQSMFGEDFFISINISVRQMEKENFLDTILSILKKHGLSGRSIHLEITESFSTASIYNFKEKLKSLKEMGFAIAIDDFGTGYSSYGQLRDSNIDYIKIDRSFIDGIDKKPDNKAIVEAIIVLGRALGARIIGEGLETREEFDIMKDLGCDFYQGFLAKRPSDEYTITNFIQDKNFEILTKE